MLEIQENNMQKESIGQFCNAHERNVITSFTYYTRNKLHLTIKESINTKSVLRKSHTESRFCELLNITETT